MDCEAGNDAKQVWWDWLIRAYDTENQFLRAVVTALSDPSKEDEQHGS